MTSIKTILSVLLAGFVLPLCAQRAMTPDDLAAWSRITESRISDNGQWVAYRTAPWIGDASVYIRAVNKPDMVSVHPAGDFAFSSSSRFAVVSRVIAKARQDSLKLRHTKKELMPLPQLLICRLGGTMQIIDSVKVYQLADSAEWVAYKRTSNDSMLYVRSLDGEKLYRLPNVSDFRFAKRNARLWFVSAGDSLNTKAGLYTFQPESGSLTLIREGKGAFRQTTFSEDGSQLAFLYCEQKDSVGKALDLWLSEQDREARMIASRRDAFLPDAWVISPFGKLTFSKSGSRLYFGTSPAPHEEDTTQLAENRANVQIWTWNEPVQHTVQLYRLKQDLEKNYLAVCLLPSNRLFQIEDSLADHAQADVQYDLPYALSQNNKPYAVSEMWEGRSPCDYYAVSMADGTRRLLKQAAGGFWSLSPEGKYAAIYQAADSSYYTMGMADGTLHRLTTPQSFRGWDEDNDVPDYPYPYGVTGWTKGDRAILLNDRYDIWQFDPDGKAAPVNLTVNGRSSLLKYSYTPTDPDGRRNVVDTDATQLLTAMNEKTKGYGFYRADLSKATAPACLKSGHCRLDFLAKAKHADALIFTSESFTQFPEIMADNSRFKQPVQISREGKQQRKYRWGTVELVQWKSLDGRRLEGLLYKPDGFDPTKKYPMIVNFYERSSDELYEYRQPEIHRSTVDYHLYLSNGYLVFNPDVRYVDGHPGESCYNCVIPGVQSIIDRGFVNEKAIGAQGHSWGGYQVAYLTTRTDLFAAIESGAPVVNMSSAYGGIRWGSGMARSFQYEHTQSRIGNTPWGSPSLYLENSPLFTMDKVKTPTLIMHNDADGHVPWYQGIEYFVALRRLQKPAWLLNYTGEPHWPLKKVNEKDFQTRMFQFFNHYLKGDPMPRWMKEGIPATRQSYDSGM